ncbi:MAG: site-2 protease family protein [Lentisphaerae bacterium]|jgi:Zn-dependent protease|nr:site-2 protease family protein [Lentisphaerota bacterium]
MFFQKLWEQPVFYFSWILIVVFSICVHEFAHALAARSQGDDTASENGFMSLDPRRVMGYQSLIALALFGIAWGAVPVNPSRYRSPASSVLVSLAGPLANAVLAFFFAVIVVGIFLLSNHLSVNFATSLTFFFGVGVRANSLLLVFNLLPIPMLDGWSVAEVILPPLRGLTAEQRGAYSLVAILLVCFSPLKNIVFRLSELFNFIILSAIWAVVNLFKLI